MSRRVLFATSNGTGLGHLNRAMSIARRLPGDVESSFFTLSAAAPVVADRGFEVEYMASYRRPSSGTDRAWNLRLRAMLERLLVERRPDLVVFDGVHPYRALTHVLSSRSAPPSVWCRRPMWRSGSSGAPLARAGAFDAVLEPGELAASVDGGPTVPLRSSAVAVNPIVYLDENELLPRVDAAAELGIDPTRRTVLVNLGQGGEVDAAVARFLGALAANGGVQIAVLESSIGPGLELPDEVVRLRATFPMSRYFGAFDLAVAASGYNSFHELIAFAVPTLFVPMKRDTDDQAARARWAAQNGVGLAVAGPADPSLQDRLAELLEPTVAEALARRCREVGMRNGAEAASRLLTRLLGGDWAGVPSTRNRGRLSRWLRLSAHPVGPTLPLSLALGARDLARNPDRRSPYLVVLALGVPEDELGRRLREAIGDEDPARTLVLTDSLRFDLLRRLGVGFELLPSPPEPGRGSFDGMESLRARLRLLLAGRRPLRAKSIGWGGPELLGLEP